MREYRVVEYDGWFTIEVKYYYRNLFFQKKFKWLRAGKYGGAYKPNHFFPGYCKMFFLHGFPSLSLAMDKIHEWRVESERLKKQEVKYHCYTNFKF